MILQKMIDIYDECATVPKAHTSLVFAICGERAVEGNPILVVINLRAHEMIERVIAFVHVDRAEAKWRVVYY